MSTTALLCVDDEQIILDSLRIELEEALGDDYLIEVAQGAAEALELFSTLRMEHYDIPVVIADYIMPEMRGDEFLRQIHAIAPKTLKIMLTGQASIEGVTNAINTAQLYRYIAKPWQATDLKLTIKEAVQSYFQEREIAHKNAQLQSVNQALATAKNQLEDYSHTLEEKVEERTQQLQQEILERKQTEIALQRAKEAADNANRTKGEFLANMSHEIRTPMNAILGFCDLLKGLVTQPRPRSYLNYIAASGKTLLTLINDILDLSKIEAGKLELSYEPVNLREIAQETHQIFAATAARKGLSLLIEVDEAVPAGVNFDEVRLRQIIFNVVGNAIKFTEQGAVTLAIATQPSAYSEHQVQLEFRVNDTGIGIAPEDQDRIFEVFAQGEGQSTRKYEGSGLGLAITRRLTEMLKGTIELQSVLGEGSTFTVVFPAVELTDRQPVSLMEVELDGDFSQFQAATVLVADDVQSNRDLMRGYFDGTQHQLLLAQDGQVAIEMAVRHQPDLILMDLRMPTLNGQEAIQALKQHPRTHQIPIVILTASAQADRHQFQALCDGFLRKPVSRYQLVAEFKKLLPVVAPPPPPASPLNAPMPDLVLAPNPQAQWPILLEKLDQEEREVWPSLCQTLKMRDLRNFAVQLQAWGKLYQCPMLLDYAVSLAAQIEAFDWNQLPQTVASFPRIRQALAELYTDIS